MPSFRIAPDLADKLLRAVNADLAVERAARSDDRVHVSEVIYCLRKSWRKRKLAEAGLIKEEAPHPTLLFGHGWDGLMGRAISDTYMPHQRIETPELIGEADGIGRVDLPDGPEWIVFEHKTTAAGPQTPAPLRWAHWVEQVASYLAMSNIGRRGLLMVLHLSMPKVVKAWLLSFTPTELSDWLAEIKRRAAIVTGPDEPPTWEAAPADAKTGMSWECQYCPFLSTNGGDCEGSTGRARSFFSIQPEEWTFNK